MACASKRQYNVASKNNKKANFKRKVVIYDLFIHYYFREICKYLREIEHIYY